MNREQHNLQNKNSNYISQHFSDEAISSFLENTLKPYEQSIKILMIGDVVGRGGRKILKKSLAKLKETLKIDLVTINGENLAGGFGITEKIYHEMIEHGVDVITMGNHWKDKNDVHRLREKYKNLVLPHNIKGISDIGKAPLFFLPDRNKSVSVINLMGVYAMKEEYENPFQFLIREKENYLDKIKSNSHIMIADIHAEASSEKQAIAWFYDGILSALIGTHTHTPTSDERITSKGTAFLTDVGMTGPYASVIGMNADRVIKRLSAQNGVKVSYELAEEDLWFCGFLIEIDPQTCLASSCTRLQCRGLDEERWLVSYVGK